MICGTEQKRKDRKEKKNKKARRIKKNESLRERDGT